MTTILLLGALIAQPPAGWRAAGEALGRAAEIEVRSVDAERAERALGAAFGRLRSAGTELMEATARLNAAAGAGPLALSPPVIELLARASDFCDWSEGAHGPAGGAVYRLWHGAVPQPGARRRAADSAGCDRLRVDREAGTAELAAGSVLDLRGFAAGWAVDRAVDELERLGVAEAHVRLGTVERAVGAGPGGSGWRAEPYLPGVRPGEIGTVRLRDRALAVVGREPALVIAGDRYPPHLNLRFAGPPAGVVATVAVTELAVDAQALATAMFVTPQREGMLRLGALRPQPSVLWLLGQGEGPPLVTSHRWSAVTRP